MASEDNRLDIPGGKPHRAIEHVLLHAREVLPGTQLFLGFQVVSVFLDGFQRLPILPKYVHLASVALVMLSTILLLVPDGGRLLGLYGGETPRFHRFARRIVLAGLVLLALGAAADGFVAVRVVTGSSTAALIAPVVLLAGCMGAWLGCRRLAGSAISAPDPRAYGRRHGR